MKYIKPYLKKYLWYYIIGITAIIIVDIVQLYIPQITGDVTDRLREGTIDANGLIQVAIQILLITIGLVIGRFIWRYFIFGTSRKIEYHLRNDLFEQFEKLSLRYFTEHKTGDLMAHGTNDLNAVRMAIGPGIMMVLDVVVLTTTVIGKMSLNINPTLTMVAIIPLPFIAVGGLLFGRAVRKRFSDKQAAFSKLTDQVQENISGIRVVKAFIQETKEVIAFQKTNEHNFQMNMRVVRLFAFMMPLMGVVSGISILIALGYGGYLTMIGTISLGDFVAFNQYLGTLVWPMMALGWCINIFSQGSASLQRIQIILDEEPEIVDLDTIKDISKLKGHVEVRNLSFAYSNEGAKVLKNISFEIKEGETLAILGRTGSGKTTLVNLLVRLYNPPAKTIFMDGMDIFDIPLKSLRESIGYVPQDNFLFSDTIAHNIGFGVLNPGEKEIENAAKIANVHDNIIAFPKQYETVVGERGVTLSGGQKQRTSIARAFMKDPAILILDDALSAVDTHTEEQILKNLKEKRKNKTNILIAHRISTVQHADHILVLKEGTMVEYGTHQELLKQKGIYYEMVQEQLLEEQLQDA